MLIGLESPGHEPLQGLESRSDFKFRASPRYLESVRAIERAGITVNGCFILGLDGHTTDVFDDVLDFAQEAPLFDVQITVLTPFPGTPLYDRLLREGRLLEPGRWDLCTLFDVNFRPSGMSPDELRRGIRGLSKRLYSRQCTSRRREAFFRLVRHHRRAPALV